MSQARPMTREERRALKRRIYVRKRYESALVRAGRRQSWIYVIGCDEVRLVKIGISSDVPGRLAGLQVGSPVELRILWTMPGSIDMEQDLHEYFRAYRRHGEWFDFGDENPVAMVAGAAVLLGYWQPLGPVETSSKNESSAPSEDAAEPKPPRRTPSPVICIELPPLPPLPSSSLLPAEETS